MDHIWDKLGIVNKTKEKRKKQTNKKCNLFYWRNHNTQIPMSWLSIVRKLTLDTGDSFQNLLTKKLYLSNEQNSASIDMIICWQHFWKESPGAATGKTGPVFQQYKRNIQGAFIFLFISVIIRAITGTNLLCKCSTIIKCNYLQLKKYDFGDEPHHYFPIIACQQS